VIKLAYESENYRRVLSDVVQEGDVVLELGPHVGKSTTGYVDFADEIVLVDKGKDCFDRLSQMQKDFDDLVFVYGDVRGFDAIKLVLQHINECDVLAVDLGGGRFPDTVFKVWATWSGVFKPRDSVVRNRGLIEFIKKSSIEDGLRMGYSDSGWLNEYGRSTPYKLREQLKEFKHWVDIDEPIK